MVFLSTTCIRSLYELHILYWFVGWASWGYRGRLIDAAERAKEEGKEDAPC